MKMMPTKTIFICVLASGLAAAQSPTVIQNTRTTMNAVHGTSAAASNAALGIQEKAPVTKAPVTQTPVIKPAAYTPGATATVKPVAAVTSKPGSKTAHAHVAHKSAHAKGPHADVKAKAPVDAAKAGATAPASEVAEKPAADDQSAPENSKWSGKRDPFISPVVSRAASGSNCSSGKKCLEIGTINLRGVVHGESGFIAVVSNSVNKAYFLRENDPVFNGYVVRITGDSIVFQETLQDRLGKTFTREVVKKITIPAV
jgi:hypothetical protein